MIDMRVSLFLPRYRSISEKWSVDKWLWFLTRRRRHYHWCGAAAEYILLLYSRSYPYQLAETTYTSILCSSLTRMRNSSNHLFANCMGIITFFQSNWSYYPHVTHHHIIIRYSYLRSLRIAQLFVFACPLYRVTRICMPIIFFSSMDTLLL